MNPPSADPPSRGRPLLEGLALAGIVLLGVAVRVDDLAAWREHARSAFFEGLPLLVNLDGYHVLSLARDLLDGGYGAVDPLLAAPEGAPRPDPPPLLALLTAGLARLTGAPLEWVAAYLPALAGPLAALPVFAVGRRAAGPVAGLAAALLTVTSVYYASRTTFGFHDTDCLAVFFAVALAWWSLRLARDRPARPPWGWVLQGAGLYLLFLWWWTGAWLPATALAAWSLLCALAACGWRRADLAAAGAACTALVAAAIAWRGADLPALAAGDPGSLLRRTAGADTGTFPDASVSIDEQTPAGLSALGEQTLGDPLLAAVAAAGLAWLALARPRVGLVLLAPLALALLGVLHAQRFLVFAAPLAGLGIGWLAARGVASVGRPAWRRAAVVAGVLAVAAPSVARTTGIVHYPAATAELATGMRWLSRETPPGAVVWTLWDHAPMLRYVGRRAVVTGDPLPAGDLAVYAALPFAAASFREAANFMQFHARHGRPGLERLYRAAGGPGPGLALARRLFAAGPDDARALIGDAGLAPLAAGAGPGAWLAFLFPADAPALYLMPERSMLRSARWWYRIGSWDVAAGHGHDGFLRPFDGLVQDGAVVRGDAIAVDLLAGTAALDGEPPRPLSRIALGGPGDLRSRDFAAQGPVFHYLPKRGLGALMDARVASSVFAEAFVLEAVAPAWFRPLQTWSGAFQIWEVRGDAPGPGGG